MTCAESTSSGFGAGAIRSVFPCISGRVDSVAARAARLSRMAPPERPCTRRHDRLPIRARGCTTVGPGAVRSPAGRARHNRHVMILPGRNAMALPGAAQRSRREQRPASHLRRPTRECLCARRPRPNRAAAGFRAQRRKKPGSGRSEGLHRWGTVRRPEPGAASHSVGVPQGVYQAARAYGFCN